MAAAEREGVVAVATAPGDAYRQASAAFAQAFPRIRLEVNGASGREFAPRILSERQADKYDVDVYVAGPGTATLVLKPQGVFDPLRPTPFERFFFREPINGYVFEIIDENRAPVNT